METKRTVVVGDDRRYVEAVPRGLLVGLADGSGEVRVLVHASPRRHRVLTPVLLRRRRRQKDVGPASAGCKARLRAPLGGSGYTFAVSSFTLFFASLAILTAPAKIREIPVQEKRMNPSDVPGQGPRE
jgi:hypothetical protein